jgi:hypothetical protein
VAREEEDLLLAGKTRQLWPLLAGAAAALLGLEMLLLALWRRPLRTSRESLTDAMAARERNLEAVR